LDGTIVVSAPPEIQHARVMARPGMTEEKFQSILAKQMPDAEKRRRADHVISTEGTLEDTFTLVRRLVAQLTR
jgi:dephospho-CoA kinase